MIWIVALLVGLVAVYLIRARSSRRFGRSLSSTGQPTAHREHRGC